MSTRINANGKRVGYTAHATAEYHFLLQAMQDEMSSIRKHLVKEAEKERDEYCKQLQDARLELTFLKVSGTLRGNAEQLPRASAEGSQEESDADLVGSDPDHGDIGGVPVLPRERQAPASDPHT